MLKRIRNKYRKLFAPAEEYGRSLGATIGKDCLISTKNFPSESYLITIGNYVRVAADVSFFTHGGLWSQRKKFKNLEYFGKINIGDYTYIGEGAKIMPGVNIGSDVIVGAGSVVTKSIGDGLIVAGNPARIVGKTEDFVKKIQAGSLPTYGMTYVEKRNYLLSISDENFVVKPLMSK